MNDTNDIYCCYIYGKFTIYISVFPCVVCGCNSCDYFPFDAAVIIISLYKSVRLSVDTKNHLQVSFDSFPWKFCRKCVTGVFIFELSLSYLFMNIRKSWGGEIPLSICLLIFNKLSQLDIQHDIQQLVYIWWILHGKWYVWYNSK